MITNANRKMLAVCATLIWLVACKPGADATTEKAASNQEAKPSQTAAMTATPESNDHQSQGSRGGSAGFGDSVEKVRKAYSKPMLATTPAEGSSCLYLYPETDKHAKHSVGYMFEDNKFVRFDVYDDSQAAPGNIRVGDSADTVKTKFAGRLEEAPHKYIEKGFTLTVTPQDKTAVHLVFEIDANGRVSSWRLGVPPQVFYVEGCG
ncbi:MAG: hypothetical protein ACREO1_02285 [Arenimonas sp.]